MEEQKTERGYKGFKPGLKCFGNYQFVMGQLHTEHVDPNRIYMCGRGFHYCERLADVFKHYKNNDTNIFCEVEVSGKIIKSIDKSVCQTIKVIKQLSKEEMEKILLVEIEEELDRIFCLDIIGRLQAQYNFIIGGSTSLHISGYTLERQAGKVDLDIIMPYYQKLETFEDIEIEEFDGGFSGSDYSQTYGISSVDGRFIKADIRVCPTQRYDIVNYKNNKYKVCDIMTTLEAKCRYAMEGNSKHRKDIMYLLKNRVYKYDDNTI